MTVRRAASAAVVLLLAASAAFAMSSGPSSPPPQPTQPGLPDASDPGRGQVSPRQEAEQSYALAYEEVGKAKQDIEDGKPKKAEKKFQRALERCEKAVLLDERYHEAWNLLGFTARKLGDYDKAFKAYDRCLMIRPDYAPAREYLGEAWLEKGDPKQARLQMAWLERLGATEELKVLKAHYDVWAAAHPDSAAPPHVSPPALADSSTAAAPASSGP